MKLHHVDITYSKIRIEQCTDRLSSYTACYFTFPSHLGRCGIFRCILGALDKECTNAQLFLRCMETVSFSCQNFIPILKVLLLLGRWFLDREMSIFLNLITHKLRLSNYLRLHSTSLGFGFRAHKERSQKASFKRESKFWSDLVVFEQHQAHKIFFASLMRWAKKNPCS